MASRPGRPFSTYVPWHGNKQNACSQCPSLRASPPSNCSFSQHLLQTSGRQRGQTCLKPCAWRPSIDLSLMLYHVFSLLCLHLHLTQLPFLPLILPHNSRVSNGVVASEHACIHAQANMKQSYELSCCKWLCMHTCTLDS